MTRVLVLGGTGFIGTAVAAAIADMPDVDVTIAGRHRPPEDPSATRTRFVHCDVLNAESINAALTGIDTLVNCFRERSSERESGRAISTLLHAIESSDVRHVVYLSSTSVYGNASGELDELSPSVEPLNWYGRAKLHAEREVLSRASTDLHVSVLRPALVYGPRGREWSLDFMESIKRGYFDQLTSAADGVANLVYVDDLAAFCARLVVSPLSNGTILNVNGTERVGFHDYFSEIMNALLKAGVPVRSPRRPSSIRTYGRALARRVLTVAQSASGARFGPDGRLTRSLATVHSRFRARPEERVGARYTAPTYFSPEKAVQAGFSPSTSMVDGVRQSVEWAVGYGRV